LLALAVGLSSFSHNSTSIEQYSFARAGSRVDTRGERHYFVSANTTNGARNGYAGFDSFCNSDPNAISGREYHAYASNSFGRGFASNILYSNATYGTFVVGSSQSPDICRVLGITCDTNYAASGPNEYVWNTKFPGCNSWTTNSGYTGNVMYQPLRTSIPVGSTSVSAGSTWNCNDQRRVLCIEDTADVGYTITADPFFVDQAMSWTSAQSYCLNEGARLAYIDSSATNDAIKALGGSNTLWLGYNDRSQESNFDWDGGYPEVYTHWAGGEPNDVNGEDCTEMRTDKWWNDLPCNYSLKFVCTYN